MIITGCLFFTVITDSSLAETRNFSQLVLVLILSNYKTFLFEVNLHCIRDIFHELFDRLPCVFALIVTFPLDEALYLFAFDDAVLPNIFNSVVIIHME